MIEDFIIVALRDALGVSKKVLVQGAAGRSIHLDEEKRIRLRPDISLWEGNFCRFVGDVKYKLSTDRGGEQGDIYQLLAYTVATDLPSGVLIYAAAKGDIVAHQITQAKKNILVFLLDLQSPLDQILTQIKNLARSIQSLYKKIAA